MCFPGVSTKDIEVWPADDGELVVLCAAVEQLRQIDRAGLVDLSGAAIS